MSLKFKYIALIGLLHLVLVVLVYYTLEDHKWVFILSEILIFISLYMSYRLYKALIKPIELMQSGTEALKEADYSIRYLKTGSSEMDKLIEVFNSMTDALREEKIAMSEQSYFIQKLIDATPIGIIIMDYDGNVSRINPSARNMLGLKRAEGIDNLSNSASSLARLLNDLPISDPAVISLNAIERYKCQVSEVIHQGFKRKFILIDDLSMELLKSEKDAYGKVIRMMAHEVNNSIGAVNSILDTVHEFGFADNTDPELRDSLRVAKERNDQLNIFMAKYAEMLRVPAPQLRPMDLCELVKKCGQLFRPMAQERDISIEFDFKKEPVTVLSDPILLEQVLSNVIKNAIESIHNDGDIVIKITGTPLSCVISDNGMGIPDDVEAKLFSPFFSTKPTGQGVGLMLTREILTSLNAQFSLKTNHVSGWTDFKIVF